MLIGYQSDASTISRIACRFKLKLSGSVEKGKGEVDLKFRLGEGNRVKSKDTVSFQVIEITYLPYFENDMESVVRNFKRCHGKGRISRLNILNWDERDGVKHFVSLMYTTF